MDRVDGRSDMQAPVLVDVDKIDETTNRRIDETTNNKGMAMNATLNSSSLEYHQPCRGLSRTRSTDTLRGVSMLFERWSTLKSIYKLAGMDETGGGVG